MKASGEGSGAGLAAVVCIAAIADPEEQTSVERLWAAPGDVERVVNPADRAALEAALLLRDMRPGVRVIALSLAAPRQRETLRWALAQGADELRVLWDEGCAGSDSIGVASILGAAARTLGAALILCGSRALDGNGGGVGPAIAELLGVPVLTGVTALRLEDSLLRAERRLGGGLRAEVECELPAVVTVDVGALEPRYARLRDRFRAMRADIPVQEPGAYGSEGVDPLQRPARVVVQALSRPKPITRGMFVPDQALSPEEQLSQLMGGGPVAVASRPSGGGIEEAIRFLEERRFLD